MKLASYRDGSRDGQLIVVSRDLSLAHYASGIAGRLQQVLDDWNFLSPQLEELSQTLNHGKARHAFAFEPATCLAPLPRAYQHAVSRADDAVLHQWPGDALHGAHDLLTAAEQPIDTGAGFAAITGDIAPGSTADAALEGIRLLMLTSVAASTSAFGPVAVTPDELGAAWHGGRVRLGLDAVHDGRRATPPNGGDAGSAHFGTLIASLCAARAVRAGSIVAWCASSGAARERLRLDAKGDDGASVFGAIDRRAPAPADSAGGA